MVSSYLLVVVIERFPGRACWYPTVRCPAYSRGHEREITLPPSAAKTAEKKLVMTNALAVSVQSDATRVYRKQGARRVTQAPH